MKKHISTSICHVQHPKADRNIQNKVYNAARTTQTSPITTHMLTLKSSYILSKGRQSEIARAE